MTREFVELPGFRSDWKELGMTDSDLKRLQHELLINPEVGAIMQETGGVRKMRFSYEHRGKSGSIRVVYIDFELRERIYLLATFAKNVQTNLTKAERNNLKKLVKVLED